MAKFIVNFQREKCIGCGACAAICPANWQMKDDGKANPIEVELEETGCNKQAEENCPANCIQVIKTE
jgi:ferredoxin